jgi:hypothetical protein
MFGFDDVLLPGIFVRGVDKNLTGTELLNP